MTRVCITGANRGLGFALAKAFLNQDATVVATFRTPPDAEALAELEEHSEGRLIPVRMDVADQASVEEAAIAIGHNVPALDILINNAGVTGKRGPDEERHREMGKLDGAALREVFEINAIGPLLVTQALLPLVRRGDDPRIIMISSSSASLENRDTAGTYDYGASKAALNMIARNMSADFGDDGPRVFSVHPGSVRTDMNPTGDIAPDEAASEILDLALGTATVASGSFVDRHGQPMPW